MEPPSATLINTGNLTANYLKTKVDMAPLTDDSIGYDLTDVDYQKESDAVDADAVEELSVTFENSVYAKDVDRCEDKIESDESLDVENNVPGDAVTECRHSDSTTDASIFDEMADGNDKKKIPDDLEILEDHVAVLP